MKVDLLQGWAAVESWSGWLAEGLARDWKGRAARRRGAAAGREASGARALESPLRW